MGRRTRQRGQSMVEFGILALLFTLILFAIADFGMLLNGWVAVSSASREGGRLASLGTTVWDVADRARNFVAIPGVPPSALKVHVTYCNPAGACQTWCRGYGTAVPTGCHSLGAETDLQNVPGAAMTPPPAPGDSVRVTVVADTFEVITPLVRPFFNCGGNIAHCYVPIISGSTAFYEGNRPPP